MIASCDFLSSSALGGQDSSGLGPLPDEVQLVRRVRWRIENLCKYAAAHQVINTLADCTMDLAPNTAMVANRPGKPPAPK